MQNHAFLATGRNLTGFNPKTPWRQAETSIPSNRLGIGQKSRKAPRLSARLPAELGFRSRRHPAKACRPRMAACSQARRRGSNLGPTASRDPDLGLGGGRAAAATSQPCRQRRRLRRRDSSWRMRTRGGTERVWVPAQSWRLRSAGVRLPRGRVPVPTQFLTVVISDDLLKA